MRMMSPDDVMKEVTELGRKYPKGWGAVYTRNETLHCDVMYFIHPDFGIYAMNTYPKSPLNPYRGVGGRIAKKVDERILEQQLGMLRFDIQVIDWKRLIANIKNGACPFEIFAEAFEYGTSDRGVEIPVKGPLDISRTTAQQLRELFSEKQKKLDSEFRKLLERDGILSAYG